MFISNKERDGIAHRLGCLEWGSASVIVRTQDGGYTKITVQDTLSGILDHLGLVLAIPEPVKPTIKFIQKL